MQASMADSRNSTHKQLRDLPGMKLKSILADMPFCDRDSGYEVKYGEEGFYTVRGAINDLKKTTILRFETESTKAGILVWRLPDAIENDMKDC